MSYQKKCVFFIKVLFFCYFCSNLIINTMRKIALLLFPVAFLCFLGGCSCKGEAASDAEEPVDTLSMLVMQVQKCSRLYTTEYRVHKIVTYNDVVKLRGRLLSRDYNVQLPLGDRKVAIPMDATLKGYVDFSGFSAANVQRSADGKIVITLPDPRVAMTDTKIDQKGIREYVSLTRAHFSDSELSAFEQQGRDAIIASIPQMGIIETARQSAARQIIPIVVGLGYREQDVTISFSRDFGAGDIRRLIDLNSIEK